MTSLSCQCRSPGGHAAVRLLSPLFPWRIEGSRRLPLSLPFTGCRSISERGGRCDFSVVSTASVAQLCIRACQAIIETFVFGPDRLYH